jgi:hypothetical protein
MRKAKVSSAREEQVPHPRYARVRNDKRVFSMKNIAQTNAARGQPPRAALFRRPCEPPSRRLGRRDDCIDPTAPSRLPPKRNHIYRRCYQTMIRRTTTRQLVRLTSSPNPLARAVEEAAMPGQPDAHAFPISPGNSPSRITGLPLARSDHRSAALKRSYVFGEPTLPQIVASRNRKTFRVCAEAVEDETSLWNLEEKCSQIKFIENKKDGFSIT